MDTDKANVAVTNLLLGLLFIAFLVLKLTDVIDWSWWWVTAPLWGMPVLVFAAFGVAYMVAFLCDRRR